MHISNDFINIRRLEFRLLCHGPQRCLKRNVNIKKNFCNYLFNSNISSELEEIRSEGFQLLIKNDRTSQTGAALLDMNITLNHEFKLHLETTKVVVCTRGAGVRANLCVVRN